ncbi:hypothetical protein [Mycobacteroides abscessus]|uniref:hypothetical protein n=1 Tax=Mycobacteroides abscessus TaxID=36809 RepID=UPI00092BE4CC|nr:hypothetical protein [Mycobacteroides abscessus]SIA36743.1 Uncharacterised protein [Mycobacteroides abscessus subsp. abscessus]SIA40574.1 Uncharacterised protein [Mycobacteroides abscessus subsp. abscessus]SIA52448.1 Uncharacterised protein [Mycobacteroides abscessus subsp. abscessus]SIA56514.1 Uncharacterised protein [Mycobacteroides abscessus subsp. abscessus]SIA81980.1 Uncharacterised protein [Mycobacteroides abscessus subsp. abscessus]
MPVYSAVTRSHLNQVQRNAERLEISLPEPLVEAVASARALVEKAQIGGGEATNALVQSVIGCMKKGRDYHTDPVVTGHLLDHVLVQIGLERAARDEELHMVSDALNAHADTILADWSKHLEPYADSLIGAAELIPTDDLNDGPTITKAGPQAVIAWSEALVARERFSYATEGFGALLQAAGIDGDRAHTLIANGDAAAAHIVTTRANGRREALRDAWHVARCGYRPVLPTITGYVERLGQAALHDDPLGV